MAAVLTGCPQLDAFVQELAKVEINIVPDIKPQDPVIFSGTVRYNLDPGDKHSDDEIWAALERCSMAEAMDT